MWHEQAKGAVKDRKRNRSISKRISLCEELQKDKEIRSGNAKKIMRMYKIVSKSQILSIKEELKQKLQVKALRLRRYERRSKFFRQNKIFETDAKKFYREINKSSILAKNFYQKKRCRNFGVKCGEMRKVTK